MYRKNRQWCSFSALPIAKADPEFLNLQARIWHFRSITGRSGDFKICYCSSAVVDKPHQWQSSLYPVKNDFNILCHIFLLIRIKENSRLQNSIKPRHSEIWKMLKGLFNLHMYRDFCSSQSNNPHMWIFIFSSWILRCLESTYLLM